MVAADGLILDFTHFPEGEETHEFHLGQSFFASFEGDEICDGDIDLLLTIAPLGTDRLSVSLDYVGEVVVECDRCLLPLVVEMDVLERVDVVIGEELDDQDDELITLPKDHPIYDFSWVVYELLALHLPLQRVHEIEECDPEMIRYLLPEEPRAEMVEDPRWTELKREMDKKKNNN